MRGLLKRYLLFLGAYIFTVPVVSFIHEIGHILAYLSIGITKFKLVLNPFTGSMAMPLEVLPEEHVLYLASSGMLFQLLVCGLVWVLFESRASFYRISFRMLLPMGLLNVGGYMLASGVADGDTAIMVQYGALPSVLTAFGVVSLILGLVCFSMMLPDMGFNPSKGVKSTFLPLFLGMETYSVGMVLYVLMSGAELWIGLVNVITSILFSILVSTVFARMPRDEPLELTQSHVYSVLGLGVITVLLALILF